MKLFRKNETINGRAYVIEVQLVGTNQWRAQLARRESTTALMPFYGPTPEAAAEMLSRWLRRAGGNRTEETGPPVVHQGDPVL